MTRTSRVGALIETSRKDTVRRTALLARSRVPEEQRGPASQAVAAAVMGLPEIRDAGAVLAFASFGAEMPTDPLLEALLAAGKRLLLPYVEADGSMKVAPVTSLGELVPGFRGIREPAGREPVQTVDAAVVPGVAFDAAGGRLGYGGGFFDRFLATLAPDVPIVGICFDAQIVTEVPREEHDRPVHVVVTERRILRAA